MEEQTENGSSYVIVRDGPFYKIKHNTRWVGGSFTEIFRAQRWIDAQLQRAEEKEFKKELKQILKEPDLKKRTRKYNKLCQTKKSS